VLCCLIPSESYGAYCIWYNLNAKSKFLVIYYTSEEANRMDRVINHEIMPEIKKRWSPRAFSNRSVAADKLRALLEAARYAPSCSNEQPWRFLVADSKEKLTRMRSILNAGNQEWANKAPVLILVTALKNSKKPVKITTGICSTQAQPGVTCPWRPRGRV
jgi:nitroreductase